MIKIEGKVEFISYKRFGVKIENEENWFNAKNDAVKQALEQVKKGDEVEYNNKGKELTFIKTIGRPTEVKTGDQVKQETDLDKLMFDTIVKANEFYNSKALTKEFKDKIVWDDIIISLFIQKCNGRRK